MRKRKDDEEETTNIIAVIAMPPLLLQHYFRAKLCKPGILYEECGAIEFFVNQLYCAGLLKTLLILFLTFLIHKRSGVYYIYKF